MFKRKQPYIDRKGNIHINNKVYYKKYWEYLLSENIKDEESTRVYKDGFEEGYICGMQEMIHKTVEAFLLSDEAKKHHLKKFNSEVGCKRDKKDIKKLDHWINSNWF